jgi:hypothetical protein
MNIDRSFKGWIESITLSDLLGILAFVFIILAIVLGSYAL